MSNVNSVIFISLKIFLVRKLLVYLILLPIVGLFIIKFNEYGIQGVKKNLTDRPIPVKLVRVKGNKNIFKVGLIVDPLL